MHTNGVRTGIRRQKMQCDNCYKFSFSLLLHSLLNSLYIPIFEIKRERQSVVFTFHQLKSPYKFSTVIRNTYIKLPVIILNKYLINFNFDVYSYCMNVLLRFYYYFKLDFRYSFIFIVKRLVNVFTCSKDKSF